jgi:RimJ/RimL family protein N-acetyltransferase
MDDQVALEPVYEADLPLMERLVNDPAATGEHQWYGWQAPGKIARRWAENGLLDDDGGTMIVVRGEERLGLVQWRKTPTSRPAYCWTIGLIIAPEARGHGLGSHAQRLLARYLFAHSLANRVEASTEMTNIAEQRALEKAGFTREGVLRGIGFRDGAWRDGVLYSILRSDL